MRTIRNYKHDQHVNIAPGYEFVFRTVVTETAKGTLQCLYLTKFNNTDLSLVSVDGGIKVLHRWYKREEFEYLKRSAINTYGRRRDKTGAVTSGSVSIRDGRQIKITLSEKGGVILGYLNDNSSLTTISLININDALYVHMMIQDEGYVLKHILHKHIYDAGDYVEDMM